MRGINDYNDFLLFAMWVAILVLVILMGITIICMIRDEFFSSYNNRENDKVQSKH